MLVRLTRLVTTMSVAVAAIAFGVLALHIDGDIILRLGAHFYILGTNEIVAAIYMPVGIFAGIYAATLNRKHIKVDIIENVFSNDILKWIDIVKSMVVAGFFIAFAWGLTLNAMIETAHRTQVDIVYGFIPIWPVRWFVVATMVGCVAVSSARAASQLYFVITRR